MRDDRSSILLGFRAYRRGGLSRPSALYEARMDYEVRGRQRDPDADHDAKRDREQPGTIDYETDIDRLPATEPLGRTDMARQRRLTDYTVVISNMDGNDGFVEHVQASEPRKAYLAVLKRLWRETEPDPKEYPFDAEEAERDRPLMAVFEGHHPEAS